MRGLIGVVIVLGLVHLAIVEAVAVNSVASCSSSSAQEAAACSCVKSQWRMSLAVEQSIVSGTPVSADAAFRMCRAG